MRTSSNRLAGSVVPLGDTCDASTSSVDAESNRCRRRSPVVRSSDPLRSSSVRSHTSCTSRSRDVNKKETALESHAKPPDFNYHGPPFVDKI